MRWQEIIHESDDILDQARNALLDMITPLLSQGITSVTVQQVIDQLQNDPDLQGIDLSNDLIMQALEGVTGVQYTTNSAGQPSIALTPSTPSTSAAEHKSDQQQDTVDKAATRQATKDLG